MTGTLDRLYSAQFNGDAEGSSEAGTLVSERGERRGASSKDAEIRLGIMEALYWDLNIAPRAVMVEVQEGWVTLSGSVRRAVARHRADWAARGAPGVVGVTNEITVEGS